MAIRLKPKEIYRTIANRAGCSDKMVQKVWEEFDGFIVEELIRNGSCYLPQLCTITLGYKGQQKGHVPDSESGGVKIIDIEPYYICRFKPTEVLKQNINNGRVPRIELKRQKERFRAEHEIEKKNEEAKQAVIRRDEALEMAKKKRFDKIKKTKEYERMSKKDKAKYDLSKIPDSEYDYGNEED